MASKYPYLAMIVMQTIYAGMVLVSKAALNDGMNSSIFIFYRQISGAVILVPLAIIFERKNEVSLSFVTFCKIFALSFIGITLSLNAYFFGLDYTSSTLGAAAMNCLPVLTFIFAVLLRMEKVKIRTIPGIAKVFGFVVFIAGVATITFYDGPKLKPFFGHHPFEHPNTQLHQSQVPSRHKWIVGCLFFVISIICWSLWLVLQVQVLKSYPSKLRYTSLMVCLSALQSFAVAIALERRASQWKLGWNSRLLAIVYCGIMVTCVAYYLQAWLLEKKGPVFLAMSQPLNLIIAIIGSSFLLGEVIFLGSVIGGILLVISLYSVLWGKSKEQSIRNQVPLPITLPEKEFAETKEANVISPKNQMAK
ncbi:hypothetical protein UlMin_037988 [Ulmus minor]